MATNKKRKKKAEVMAEDGSMTLTGHLKELRNRLIICAVVFVVGVVVSLAYADRLIDLLTAMGRDYYQFVSIAPQEKLMQYFRVSILAGVVVTVPVAFYNIYAFAKPGLKKSESTFFKLVMLLGLILFCVGVLFAYKLMMPFMLRFLSTGIEGAEYIQTTTSIESYVNLCLTMFIIFGCVFEMPLITIILSKMGIINPQILKQVRGVAIVVIFFIAAVVTPPDIVSQCMVAFPMVLLYFVSIFVGLLTGLVAVPYHYCLYYFFNLRSEFFASRPEWYWHIPLFLFFWAILIFVSWLVMKMPLITGGGIPQTRAAINGRITYKHPFIELVSKFFGGILSVSA